MEFNGRIRGTPIVVDNFSSLKHSRIQAECDQFQMLAYFCSHAHKDHTRGIGILETLAEDQQTQIKANKIIYCSAITKRLLENQFLRVPRECFIAIEINHRRSIVLFDNKNVVRNQRCSGETEYRFYVTLLEAHHCPGSVMFYFETPVGCILYTGDHRVDAYAINQALDDKSIKLNENEISLARIRGMIDLLIFDATFCHPHCTFPTRNVAIQKVIALIWQEAVKNKACLANGNSDNFQVYISSDTLGSEPLLRAIAETFGCKLHVDRNEMNDAAQQLSLLEDIKPLLTDDGHSTFIHLRPGRYFQHFAEAEAARCYNEGNFTRNLFLKPSTLWYIVNQQFFAGKNMLDLDVQLDCFGVHHILYSMHADWLETISLIMFLEPRCVSAMNIPVRWRTFISFDGEKPDEYPVRDQFHVANPLEMADFLRHELLQCATDIPALRHLTVIAPSSIMMPLLDAEYLPPFQLSKYATEAVSRFNKSKQKRLRRSNASAIAYKPERRQSLKNCSNTIIPGQVLLKRKETSSSSNSKFQRTASRHAFEMHEYFSPPFFDFSSNQWTHDMNVFIAQDFVASEHNVIMEKLRCLGMHAFVSWSEVCANASPSKMLLVVMNFERNRSPKVLELLHRRLLESPRQIFAFNKNALDELALLYPDISSSQLQCVLCKHGIFQYPFAKR